MKRLAVGIVLLLASPLFAQSVTLPKEIECPRGRLVAIKLDWDGDDVKWTVSSELDVLREYETDPKIVRLRILAPVDIPDGIYELRAVACKDKKLSDFAVCKIKVGKPVPPIPPVPPPDPTDPLTKTLQAAYDKETDSNKAELKGKLAALYRNAAEITDRPEIVTWGNLFAKMKEASVTMGVFGKLVAVQTVVQGEFKNRFPTDASKAMTTDDRVLAAQTLKRIAAALEGVKGREGVVK